MIVPGRTTVFLAAALGLILIAAMIHPALLVMALVGDVLLVVICIAEGKRLGRCDVRIERERWDRFEIDRETQLTIRIENRSDRALTISLRQYWPAEIQADEDTLMLALAPGEIVRTAFTITPTRRGRVNIPAAEMDLYSALDFARHRRTALTSQSVSIYPSLSSVREYDRLRRHRALRQMGVHRIRMTGAGREFDQLRDYVHDDEYRDIDWKATARRRRPITRVYQAERSQHVLLCVDQSRMMGNPVGRRTTMDCAVDAAVALAHVSERSGDRVGLALFSDTVDTFVKPSGTAANTRRVIESLIDASPRGVFPFYSDLFSQVRHQLTRRAMVFLFTDLNDPQIAANLARTLPLVSRRHVVVVIGLEDALLGRAAEAAPRDRDGLYQAFAARSLADEQAARILDVRRQGVNVLQADAQHITVGVINEYLAVKMRQLV